MKTVAQQRELEALRAELAAIGGVAIHYELLPPHVELQLLRRTLEKPAYIEQEKRERPTWLQARVEAEAKGA